MPHKAFINYNSSSVNSFYIHANNITAQYKDVECLVLDFAGYNAVSLRFGNTKIDNTDIQGEFLLIIKFLEVFKTVAFCSNNLDNFDFNLFTGVPQNIIVDCETNNDNNNYTNISLDYESVIWFSESMTFFEPYNWEISVLYDGKEYILNDLPSFTPLEGGKFYVNVVNYKNTIFVSGNNIEEEILLGEINDVKAKASGTLNFVYNPEGKEYNLINQDVLLKNKDNSIESYIEGKNGKINIQLSGNVNEAYISSLDLFPTFRGWYRDNIYLIPLTLISTIFGAIKLKSKD